MIRKKRGSGAIEYVHKDDDESKAKLHAADEGAGEVLGEIGARCVKALDDGAVPEACEAWHDKFVGRWPTLRGADGGEWSLKRDLPFSLFLDVVMSTRPKAVGCSGVAAAQLRLAPPGVLRSVYNAIVGDVGQAHAS